VRIFFIGGAVVGVFILAVLGWKQGNKGTITWTQTPSSDTAPGEASVTVNINGRTASARVSYNRLPEGIIELGNREDLAVVPQGV
jgi:hypothetical protein